MSNSPEVCPLCQGPAYRCGAREPGGMAHVNSEKEDRHPGNINWFQPGPNPIISLQKNEWDQVCGALIRLDAQLKVALEEISKLKARIPKTEE